MDAETAVLRLMRSLEKKAEKSANKCDIEMKRGEHAIGEPARGRCKAASASSFSKCSKALKEEL